MVRKERAASDQRIKSPDSLALEEVVEGWLHRIRERLPDSGTVVVTIHQVSRRKYLVSFRASAFGESFISEARQESLVKALQEAGEHLFEHLSASPPKPDRRGFRERMRHLFGEAS